jgi:hypothetical protein
MNARSTAFLVGLVVLCVVASTGGGVASAEEQAAIVEQHGQWEISYGAVYYRVFGYVQNKSAKPVRYIKLQLDLVDGAGKSVYSTVGYNQKAEALGVVEGEGASNQSTPEEKLKKVEALKPGERDLFRIGISKDDIPKNPKFKSYALKIVEVK